MKKTDIAASQPSYEEILRKERRANSAWNKLRRNKTAMIGLFIIVIMTAIAVFAPFQRSPDMRQWDVSHWASPL